MPTGVYSRDPNRRRANRASNAFNEAEVALMASLMNAALRSGDASHLTRNPSFRVVAGKFARMRKLVESRRGAA